MVAIYLTEKKGNIIRWHYYPEDDHTKKSGIIEANLTEETIKIKERAQRDFFRIIPASEFNEDRDRINQERLESGEPELTEEELPTATEDEEYYTYGNMAVYRIVEDYDKGIITKKARVYWY